ncbi:MAG: hypothetical protein M3R27_16545 [Bacteroidota bacterium]|nr:hypothetical protein [Bacteroidota bacterium]
MRKVDFIGQTVLFAAAIISLLVFGNEGPLVVALVQFFVGGWQIISAIITSATINGDKILSRIMLFYWGFVVLYAIGFLGMLFTVERQIFIFWFFSAWFIAIYYYVFTCKWAFTPMVKKSFLDIAN